MPLLWNKMNIKTAEKMVELYNRLKEIGYSGLCNHNMLIETEEQV
jgi:hypothetical protein